MTDKTKEDWLAWTKLNEDIVRLRLELAARPKCVFIEAEADSDVGFECDNLHKLIHPAKFYKISITDNQDRIWTFVSAASVEGEGFSVEYLVNETLDGERIIIPTRSTYESSQMKTVRKL